MRNLVGLFIGLEINKLVLIMNSIVSMIYLKLTKYVYIFIGLSVNLFL